MTKTSNYDLIKSRLGLRFSKFNNQSASVGKCQGGNKFQPCLLFLKIQFAVSYHIYDGSRIDYPFIRNYPNIIFIN